MWLTYQIIGSNYNTAHKQYGSCDPVVSTKHHIIDNSFIDQISNLDKARESGHQTENDHFDGWLKL